MTTGSAAEQSPPQGRRADARRNRQTVLTTGVEVFVVSGVDTVPGVSAPGRRHASCAWSGPGRPVPRATWPMGYSQRRRGGPQPSLRWSRGPARRRRTRRPGSQDHANPVGPELRKPARGRSHDRANSASPALLGEELPTPGRAGTGRIGRAGVFRAVHPHPSFPSPERSGGPGGTTGVPSRSAVMVPKYRSPVSLRTGVFAVQSA